MLWEDLGLTLLAIVFLYVLLRGLDLAHRALFVLRVARSCCPVCRQLVGRKRAHARVEYYQRQHELFSPDSPPEIIICHGGPRKYRGAQVVTCPGCSTDLVYSDLGGFVEQFTPDPNFGEDSMTWEEAVRRSSKSLDER